MYNRSRVIFVLSFILSVILILNIFLYSQNHNITGFSIQKNSFYDSINKDFEGNSTFLWSPENLDKNSYIGISGNASGKGNVKISLIDGRKVIVILNEQLDNEKLFFNEYSDFKELLDLSHDKFLIRVETNNVHVFIDSIYYSNSKLGNNGFDISEMESAYIPENITINYDGRYTLLKTEEGFNLMIKNSTIKGLRQSTKVFNDFVDDSEVSTEVFAMDHIDIDNATIVLNKTGVVNIIKKCSNFEMEIGLCLSGWTDTKIPFTQTNNTISFVVNSFSAYAGGELPSIQWDSPTSVGNITNIQSQSSETWIYWTWTDPSDSDFNHTEVWLDNVFKANTTGSYNATGLTANTSYEIQLRAVDDTNNKSGWFNDTSNTSIGNSKPIIKFVEFEPYQLNYITNATVLGTYTDRNEDNGSVSFQWFVNNVNVYNNSVNVSADEQFNDVLDLGNFSLTDNVSVQITANDGFIDSNMVEINDTVGLVAPIINSYSLSYDEIGIGKQMNFNINVSDGNFSVDEVWINLSNSQKNVTINLTNLVNWTGSYVSFVPGIHYIDLYANDTNGNLEHWRKQYNVQGTFNINIEVDKTNYTLNELVEAIGLP